MVYAGRSEGDLVPVARVVSKSRMETTMPPPAPAKYDAWFVTSDELSDMAGKTVAMDKPDQFKCARECDVANQDGNATCTVFRVSDGGCELYTWEPDAVQNARDPCSGVFDALGVTVVARATDDHPDHVRQS